LKLAIVGCFNPPTTEAMTTGLTGTTGTTIPSQTPSRTTAGLPPTTTTIIYCTQEQGMNQTLTIGSSQVISSSPTTGPGDISPTSTAPGLTYLSMNPQINITLDRSATLTLIYVPVDRPNRPSNVNGFVVQFVYPNGTTSKLFPSVVPSTGETIITTSPSGTTASTTGVFPPSDASPRVDLPPMFRVPENTIVVINITSTRDHSYATGVCIILGDTVRGYRRPSYSRRKEKKQQPRFIAIEFHHCNDD